MKKFLFPFLLSFFAILNGTSITAQVKGEEILKQYYLVKDALVSGNASAASSNAGEMIKALNGFDQKSLSESSQKIVQPLVTKLLKDAGSIAGAKDIAKQREYFSSLSDAMISLTKEAKLNSAPAYIDYCPMKKSYWLSAEQPVKNPYYGSSMLSCGKVTDTLK